ncbi:DDE Tnp4 domain-containing protein [Mycena venus]|uniref:DDE Tnp4 domain-containing protein n=1 Tax=Mycena venus TaxID=2733690 RepID=A0A8H6X1W1_9AGAR|nr:DDE Tnp4 domain-containing protein [Mycena venus]
MALCLLETVTDDNKDIFDDSGSDTDTDSDNTIIHSVSLSTPLIGALTDLHSEWYLNEWQDIEKTTEIVSLLLAAFNKLLEGIKDDPVFSKNSDSGEQLPVQHQLAMTLYCFGQVFT